MTQFIVMKKKRVPEDKHQRNAFFVDPPLIRKKNGSSPIHANTSMSYPGNERLSRMADRVESARLRIWDIFTPCILAVNTLCYNISHTIIRIRRYYCCGRGLQRY